MPRVILSLVEAKNTMNIADMSICLESETAFFFFSPVSYSSKSQQNFTEEHRSWKHIKQMKISRRKAFKVKKKKKKRERNVFTLLMNASLNWKALHPPSMIILFGNRKWLPGPLRLRRRRWSGWVGGWNTAAEKRKKKTQREKQQIMEMRLHLNPAPLSEAPSDHIDHPSVSHQPLRSESGPSLRRSREQEYTITGNVFFESCFAVFAIILYLTFPHIWHWQRCKGRAAQRAPCSLIKTNWNHFLNLCWLAEVTWALLAQLCSCWIDSDGHAEVLWTRKRREFAAALRFCFAFHFWFLRRHYNTVFPGFNSNVTLLGEFSSMSSSACASVVL